jgi:RNA polymerase sigma-70 factor (ECF subfamily)
VNESADRFRQNFVDESAVIVLAGTGDADAFAELVRRHQSRVRNFLRRLCGRTDMADDLAQQTFINVWKSIGRLRSPDAFNGWLRKVMISVWLEELRRRKNVDALWDESPEDEPPGSSGDGMSAGVRLDLNAALARLAPPMRLCVVLAYSDGLSHQEISDATDIPLGTVKSYISRGAARMRDFLADYRKN